MTILVFLHSLFFLVFWVTNLIFQKTVNDFIADAVGVRLNFLLFAFIFYIFLFLWSGARFQIRHKGKKPGAGRLFTIIGVVSIVLFYGSFLVLFLKNPIQVRRLGQISQYFRIVPDAIVIILAAIGLGLTLFKTRKQWVKGSLIASFVSLWLVPVFWTPGFVYKNELPEKPLLVAHRGASTLAPENTLASMNAAVALGVYGLETDITVSEDGVPFLMHDGTLERTTNVAVVFPGREKDKAETFSWSELTQLDAGEWFPGEDQYQNEAIPTLDELLEIVAREHVILIYDLRIPADEHPYARDAFAMTLEAISRAGVAEQTWVLVEPNEIVSLQALSPGAIAAAGISYQDASAPDALVDAGYRIVNSEYGLSNQKIRAYQEAGLWVNLWTVDEPWQYSRLWLAGANSVTSNYVQDLIGMNRPVMALAYPYYLIIWSLFGFLAAGIVQLSK
jgi:glycerophosphoryl diester phosphodiesterase